MTQSNSPTVSIVIPYYKTLDLITRAIMSVSTDTRVSEIIVADDGSDDGVADLIAPLSTKVIYLGGRNAGAPSARNRGMMRASCDWILFLDADDFLDPGYVDRLASDTAGHDLVIGRHRRIAEDGSVRDEVAYPLDLPVARLLGTYLTAPIQTGAVLWRKEFLLALGGWDESLIIFQDIDLTIRALLDNARVLIADTQGLVTYWVDHDRASRISRNFSEAKAASILRTLNRFCGPIVAIGDRTTNYALAERYYGLARLAYVNGHNDIGDRALVGFYAMGFERHPGSRLHRLGCAVLGLRRKIALSRSLARLARINR